LEYILVGTCHNRMTHSTWGVDVITRIPVRMLIVTCRSSPAT
jgi:hypothetical protein